MKFLIQAIFLCIFGSIILSIWEVIEWEKGLKMIGTCIAGLIFLRIALTRG